MAYTEWFESLDLPDTFASWFNITELHVWLLMVRYMAEDVMLPSGEKKKYIKGDGHFVRNCIIEALWADVANKIKLLEVNAFELLLVVHSSPVHFNSWQSIYFTSDKGLAKGSCITQTLHCIGLIGWSLLIGLFKPKIGSFKHILPLSPELRTLRLESSPLSQGFQFRFPYVIIPNHQNFYDVPLDP